MEREPKVYFIDMESLRENWGWFLTLGIGLIVLGIAAIGAPFIATLAVETLIAWLLIIGGIILTVHAFRSRRWGKFALELAGGLLYIFVGFLALAFPLWGALTLTLLLAIFFLAEGAVKIFQSLTFRPLSNWGWMFFSGLASVALGILLWVGLPATSFLAIGLIVGIDLILGGFSMVMISLSARTGSLRGTWRCVGNECYST
jgi:uncharacterized membrane protein HdeD (DUF308 family)